MSFKKRSLVLSSAGTPQAAKSEPHPNTLPGIRASSLDGRPTTSTGTQSLDGLLGGHAGLPLGTSLLIEEDGTTDFSGTLLRYFAAEGLLQGHHVHVLALPAAWGATLPAEGSPKTKETRNHDVVGGSDKMKIAWRYEALANTATAPRVRETVEQAAPRPSETVFCHSFDLTRRLAVGSTPGQLSFYPSPSALESLMDSLDGPSPLVACISKLSSALEASPNTVHRLIIPSLLSPALYSSQSGNPRTVLQSLHALRALLRRYSSRLTAMTTLPLALHPRSSGLTRWIELLHDGVIHLSALDSAAIEELSPERSRTTKAADTEDKIQGMLKLYRLPIQTEKGNNGKGQSAPGDALSFSLSASRGLVIKPFALPPVGTDQPEEPAPSRSEKTKQAKLDF